MKKGSSIIYCLATGVGGNAENITLVKHVTGLDVGKSISYYYFPINDFNNTPKVIGSINKKADKNLLSLLTVGKNEKKFIEISSAEYIHAISTIKSFSSLSSILGVCQKIGT